MPPLPTILYCDYATHLTRATERIVRTCKQLQDDLHFLSLRVDEINLIAAPRTDPSYICLSTAVSGAQKMIVSIASRLDAILCDMPSPKYTPKNITETR